MFFNSLSFLIFFPLVVLIYFIIPRKVRYIWLLIASYYFYMSWNAKYAVLLLGSTVVTYLCGIMLSRCKKDD
ncbi:MAG: MBOAT family protein, partial [Lachnospiraceae bacterium]|nr:MBOAT family protein [Lachnospiraceae bacterium]